MIYIIYILLNHQYPVIYRGLLYPCLVRKVYKNTSKSPVYICSLVIFNIASNSWSNHVTYGMLWDMCHPVASSTNNSSFLTTTIKFSRSAQSCVHSSLARSWDIWADYSYDCQCARATYSTEHGGRVSSRGLRLIWYESWCVGIIGLIISEECNAPSCSSHLVCA